MLTRIGRKKGLDATVHPTTLDIVWAAGIYEGEGCVSRKGEGGMRTEVVCVSQKHRWILDRLCAFFGGSVGISHYGAGSRYAKHELFVWNICGARARGFLMTVYQFLSPHRRLRAKQVLGESS